MDEVRHFKTTYGTMGELFDATPLQGVSKVFFEDQMFETWNHGRTVLLGDGTCILLFAKYPSEFTYTPSSSSTNTLFIFFPSSFCVAAHKVGK